MTIPALHKYLPADKADELQARMLRDYYRLWFSWPSVCRITYWNSIDNFGMEIMYSGFLTRYDFAQAELAIWYNTANGQQCTETGGEEVPRILDVPRRFRGEEGCQA